MTSHIAGLVFTLVAACYCANAETPARAAQEVSYCELVKTPLSFSGKRIRVRAVYKYGFEIQRLDPPTCCPERGIKIWVEIGSGLEGGSLNLFHKLPKGMGLALATLVGTFESGGPYGDGGYRFKFTVDHIERVEAASKPSASHDPAWLPRDCETSRAPTKDSSSHSQ